MTRRSLLRPSRLVYRTDRRGAHSSVATNDEVEGGPRTDRVEVVPFCRIPPGIPPMGVVSTQGSSPLLPAFLPLVVCCLDKNLQIEKIGELRPSRVDALDENDVAR